MLRKISIKITRTLVIAFSALLILTGCVQSDVGINFESQTHGEIIQLIKLEERLSNLSQTNIQKWFKSIDQRARKLDGRTKRISPEQLKVIIPFNNGSDLQKKFNQFFNNSQGDEKSSNSTLENEFPPIGVNLTVKQSNLIFFLRNRIDLELDLRPLAVLSSDSNVLISPGGLLDLKFTLNTPWGAKNTNKNADILPPQLTSSQQILWQLKPGELNHVQAVFWLPSFVGIGALLITLFVAFGWYIKYEIFPRLGIGQKKKKPTTNPL